MKTCSATLSTSCCFIGFYRKVIKSVVLNSKSHFSAISYYCTRSSKVSSCKNHQEDQIHQNIFILCMTYLVALSLHSHTQQSWFSLTSNWRKFFKCSKMEWFLKKSLTPAVTLFVREVSQMDHSLWIGCAEVVVCSWQFTAWGES